MIRFFILYTHYRNTIDYSEKHLEEAGRAYERISNTITNVRYAIESAVEEGGDSGIYGEIDEARKLFIRSMDEDFNTREALANLFMFSRRINAILSESIPDEKAFKQSLDSFPRSTGYSVFSGRI